MSVISVLLLGWVMVAGVVQPGGFAPLEACSQGSRTSGECPSITSTVDSGGVSLGATATTPGSSGSQSATPGQPTTLPRLPWSPPPVRNPVLGSAQCEVIIQGSCRGKSPPKNPPVASATAIAAPIAPASLSDLASFSPGAPGIVVEPGSWSIPRLSTNIYALAGTEIQAGELLGWPIEVRFSPQRYRWSYGDGSGATHAEPGGTWGSAQFSTTPTGHIFAAPGRYSIFVDVDYSVAYRFAEGEFVTLSGLVTRGAGPAVLTVLRVTPILVDDGCSGKAMAGGRCE